ncbi:hypothetical protein ATANTOWER_014798 [Ataeniobius toweri]|uniref:Uncharacterized protein n=1 Tax=Ataeniobius toweri TaxID=208326 RepID=A0ABU7AG96_9TELE|nr:hypothetical protein [Ataeniobius toweri]
MPITEHLITTFTTQESSCCVPDDVTILLSFLMQQLPALHPRLTRESRGIDALICSAMRFHVFYIPLFFSSSCANSRH